MFLILSGIMNFAISHQPHTTLRSTHTYRSAGVGSRDSPAESEEEADGSGGREGGRGRVTGGGGRRNGVHT